MLPFCAAAVLYWEANDSLWFSLISLFYLFIFEEEQAIDFIKALPSMFPSNMALPKKMTSATEALIHVLTVRGTLCI